MKKTILGLTVASAIASAGSAGAADLPRGPAPYYAPPPASIYNWTGFYAGLNLRYEWGKLTNSNIDPSRLAGRSPFAYNWPAWPAGIGAAIAFQGIAADDT